jgi:hypothetical protein
MKPIPIQRKMAVSRPKPEDICAIRVSHRAQRKRGKGHISPWYLLRCGCCDEKLEIYYEPEDLEINGVFGSIENWRDILLPLLRLKRKGKMFVADEIKRRVPKYGLKPTMKAASLAER